MPYALIHYGGSVYVGAYGVLMEMEGNFIKPFFARKLQASVDIRAICGHAGTCRHMQALAGMCGHVQLYDPYVHVHPYAGTSMG